MNLDAFFLRTIFRAALALAPLAAVACGPDSAAGDAGPSDADASMGAPNLFTCGEAPCIAESQICELTPPDGDAGVNDAGFRSDAGNYRCAPMPSACLANPTCACVEQAERATVVQCTMSGPGALVVSRP